MEAIEFGAEKEGCRQKKDSRSLDTLRRPKQLQFGSEADVADIAMKTQTSHDTPKIFSISKFDPDN